MCRMQHPELPRATADGTPILSPMLIVRKTAQRAEFRLFTRVFWEDRDRALLDGRHFAASVVGDPDAVDYGMHSGERLARAAVARRGLRFTRRGLRFTSSSQPIVRLRVLFSPLQFFS
jgi:hypothetical protein